MHTVNIYDAKTNLSKLINAVSKGEEVVIAKAGKPIALLTSYRENHPTRTLGLLKGKMKVAKNFDDESEEINALFYEE